MQDVRLFYQYREERAGLKIAVVITPLDGAPLLIKSSVFSEKILQWTGTNVKSSKYFKFLPIASLF